MDPRENRAYGLRRILIDPSALMSMADEFTALLRSAELAIRCQVPEAIARGLGFLVCSAHMISEEAPPDLRARAAALQPGEPLVLTLPLEEIAAAASDEQALGAAGVDLAFRRICAPVPPGHVRIVLGTDDGLHMITAQVEPLGRGGAA